MKSHNELLALIKFLEESNLAKDRYINELQTKLETVSKTRKRGPFISPRLLRMVKHANRA